MKKILFLLTMATCLYSACQNEEASPNEIPDQNKVLVNIAVDNGENDQETKSVISQAENAIADITLFFFLDGKLTESIYTVPETDGTITIESTKGYDSDASVDVYGLVNMGDKRSLISAGGAVSTLKSWQYTLASMADINTSGFPMAGIEENAPVGTAFTLTVHRLVAKYGFQINTSGLKYGTFTVTGLKLKNAAKTVTPFTEGSKVTSASSVMDGDYATTANVTTLKNGGGVYFYTLENMQGTLLSGNTDPWKKIPSYIGTSANLCTYIEVTGTYKDKSGGLTATHTYNMYLGQDNVTNFDVIRNTKYEYSLTLADDGFLKATWKAGREIVSDTRSVAFSQSKYEIQYGEDCPVTMTFNPGTVPCKYTLSSNLTAAGVSFDSNYMVLRQTKELDADVTGTLTATSWDGVKTATCTVVAKEYKPGDVVIIIKPSENTINMTEPDAQTAELSLALVNPDDHTEIYEELDGTDWTVGSSNSTSFNAEFTVTKASASTVRLKGKNAGTGYITASCKYDGVTYSSVNGADNKITVNEDRTITISGLPETIYKGKAYPCTVKTNYDGNVNISTSSTSLIFSESPAGETPSYIPVIKNTEAQMYVSYNGSTNTTVSVKAETTNSAVNDTKTLDLIKLDKIKFDADELNAYLTTEYDTVNETWGSVNSEFKVTGVYSDGEELDFTGMCTYSGTNASSAKVDGYRIIHMEAGTTVITASYEDLTATMTVNTKEPDIVDFEFNANGGEHTPIYGVSLGDKIFIGIRPIWTDGTKGWISRSDYSYRNENFIGYMNFDNCFGNYMFSGYIADSSYGSFAVNGYFTPTKVGNTTAEYTISSSTTGNSISKTADIRISEAYLVSVAPADVAGYMFYKNGMGSVPSMIGTFSDGSTRTVPATWTCDRSEVTYTEGQNISINGLTEGFLVTFSGTYAGTNPPTSGGTTVSINMRYGKWINEFAIGGVANNMVGSKYWSGHVTWMDYTREQVSTTLTCAGKTYNSSATGSGVLISKNNSDAVTGKTVNRYYNYKGEFVYWTATSY